jgi:hypothetical protein
VNAGGVGVADIFGRHPVERCSSVEPESTARQNDIVNVCWQCVQRRDHVGAGEQS